jgi:hypothetical protein
VTTISKVNNMRQSKRLRSLYLQREQIAQAIQSLEQIQRLRSGRSALAALTLLAAQQPGIRAKLAA